MQEKTNSHTYTSPNGPPNKKLYLLLSIVYITHSRKKRDKNALPTVKHIIIMVVHLMGIVSVLCYVIHINTHTDDTYRDFDTIVGRIVFYV